MPTVCWLLFVCLFVCLDVPCCVSTLFHHFQTKMALLADLSDHRAIFSLFGPIFGLRGVTFGLFWSRKRSQLVCLDVSCCVSTLFRHFQTKMALLADLSDHRAIFSLFGPIFGLRGVTFGLFWSRKRSQLVCLDVSCCVSTLFHTFKTKLGPPG
jgi:hypothetical protein